MLIVPVQPVPNQTLSILLANQLCQLTLRTRFYGLFMDVSLLYYFEKPDLPSS
jgi:hypothetical protein